MYYTIYRIYNLINGKEYTGFHKTSKLNDQYFGSGKLIKRAINYYGVDNFEKEILFIFDNEQDMIDKEKEIVNEQYCDLSYTYNLNVGGFGGFNHINLSKRNINHFRDENHDQSSKDKIGKANSISQLGERNSQYGTMWITDGKVNKKIKKK